MRKIVMFNLVSLDGFFAGADGNIDWHVVDEEFNQAAIEMIRSYDTILFGRITYQLFENYWPKAALDPKISKEDKIIANKINKMRKIVFSKTLDKVTWKNSELVKGNIENEVKKIKKSPGRDIVIYGSGTIVQQLATAGLIDEYRIMVNPVVLGSGKPLFKDVSILNLKLIDTRVFRSGNVLLNYQRIKE